MALSTQSLDAPSTLQAIRAQRPLVHCLTNTVTMERVADALAALGALPVMASAPEETADMAEHAQALLLNLGTPTGDRWLACRVAGQRAHERHVPIVVDPVGCGATPWRTREARSLLKAVPADVVRANVPELAALADLAAPGAKLRGVTATAAPTDATTEQLAREASQTLKAVVLVTGERDLISDGQRVHAHRTDVAVLRRVIGAGDVLSAVIAACGGIGLNPWSAATNGLAIFAASARLAARESKGPGTFWPAFLDALATLEPEHLAGETDQPLDVAVEAQQR